MTNDEKNETRKVADNICLEFGLFQKTQARGNQPWKKLSDRIKKALDQAKSQGAQQKGKWLLDLAEKLPPSWHRDYMIKKMTEGMSESEEK